MYQKLINNLYRYPKSNWKNIQRFGGFRSYYKMLNGKKEMIKSSYRITEITSHLKGLPIYFLTGKNYFYQTLFCALSLVKNSQQEFRFILVDDGSFDKELIENANIQIPGVEIITKETIDQNIRRTLPEQDFPYLHFKRKVYPHIKKLTDIHTIASDPYKLVLDSDMLFWQEPLELINWLKDPSGCLYMLDCEESYGYDKGLMQSLCGFKIPALMNVGVFGFNSDVINWENIEKWSQSLEEKQGTSYFLEQALSAMLVANEHKNILDKSEYIVNPNEGTIDFSKAKLHHYVDLSKQYYFNNAWKKLVDQA